MSNIKSKTQTHTQVVYFHSKENIIYGKHMSHSSSKGYQATINKLINSPYRIAQIYVDNPRRFDASLTHDAKKCQDLLLARGLLETHQLQLIIHASLVNQITSTTSQYVANTRTRLCHELDMGAILGCGVVVHFGSNPDVVKGVAESAKTVEYVLSHISVETKLFASLLNITPQEFITKRRLLLENSAGEGKKMGYTLQGIQDVLSTVNAKYESQLGVCIDTAHLFGAGDYDLGLVPDVKRFFSDFDSIIGRERLWCFHLNDSRVELGSRKDKHELLGEGWQFYVDAKTKRNGLKGLTALVRSAGLRGVPIIGETPQKDADGNIIYNGGKHDYDLLNELCKIYTVRVAKAKR